MKLLRRCALIAFVVLAVSAVIAVLGFNVAFAAIGWPGIILMNAVLAWFGVYANGSESLWLWLVPAGLIDLIGYTALFYALARLWRVMGTRTEKGHPLQ